MKHSVSRNLINQGSTEKEMNLSLWPSVYFSSVVLCVKTRFKKKGINFQKVTANYILITTLFNSLISQTIFGQTQDADYKIEFVKSEFIFQNPPFKACHASTIAELSNKRLMTAWFGGSYEGAPDVGIWTSVYDDNEWSKPVELVSSSLNDSVKLPCWNPVLFKTAKGKLCLFYKQGKNPREWWGVVITSANDGKSWSAPVLLPKGFLGPIKNKPVQLPSGEILCPSSTESIGSDQWKAHMEITDETLSKWQTVAVDTSNVFGVIQPAILVHPNGKLQLLCRSRENCVVQSWSTDKGQHWSNLSKTEVPNPNSGIDAVTLSNGLHILVNNPLLKGQDWFNGRNVLNVMVSKDGIHWREVYVLEKEKEGEFSYPAIIQSSDGEVHITYTMNRTNIKHVVLNIDLKK